MENTKPTLTQEDIENYKFFTGYSCKKCKAKFPCLTVLQDNTNIPSCPECGEKVNM